MKASAGILLYRIRAGRKEVLLVHPGGPFWASKDDGAWSIPKGEFNPDEDPLSAAAREFAEETGHEIETEGALTLGEVRQKAGKMVSGWAVAGDIDPAAIRSNTFTLEWPPRTGRIAEFPEVDRAAWFNLDAAAIKVNPAQTEFLDRLRQLTS